MPFATGEIDDSTLSIEEIDSEFEDIEAGTTPESMFYSLDKTWDNLKYTFSKDKETTGLRIAEERFEEIKLMSKKGKQEKIREAKESHEKILEKVRVRIEERLNEAKDEDILRDVITVEKTLSLQEEELTQLQDLLSELTLEQRRLVLQELLGVEGVLENIKGKIDDAESTSLIKFEEKLGRSRLEIRNELDELREDKRIKAEIIGNVSVVTVEYSFKEKTESSTLLTVEDLLQKTLAQVTTTQDEAKTITKIEEGADDSESAGMVDELENENEDDDSDEQDENETNDEDSDELDEDGSEENSDNSLITGQATGSSNNDDEDSADDDSDNNDTENEDGDSDELDEDAEDEDSDEREEDETEDDSDELDEDAEDDDSDENETDDGSEEEFISKERLRVKIDLERKENGETRAEIKFKLRFISGITSEEIYADIVEQTNALTIDQLRIVARIEEENDLEENKERKVEIKVKEKDGKTIADVKYEWEGVKDSSRIESGDKAVILSEVAARLGVTVLEVESALKKFEQKETKTDDDEKTDDDLDNDNETDADEDTKDEDENKESG